MATKSDGIYWMYGEGGTNSEIAPLMSEGNYLFGKNVNIVL